MSIYESIYEITRVAFKISTMFKTDHTEHFNVFVRSMDRHSIKSSVMCMPKNYKG